MIYILFTAIGCAMGNFLYQWVNGRNWEVAFERTLFQLVPCIVMAGIYWRGVLQCTS